ncbi:MAG: hypothetical protein M1829_000589 [Trizodia sp. TS-e1964]|nr:MAG: hypothetical protein M1829_000589 [Trizodia sp. TS-e1964]
MSTSKPLVSLTYTEVSKHAAKDDVYIVIHDKIYNATEFVDEHPGGEEVLMDVGGQDATEAFEDVGHSDEAREILDKMLVGKLNRLPGDPGPPVKAHGASTSTSSSSSSSGFGVGLYALIVLGGAAAFGIYKYLQISQESKQ